MTQMLQPRALLHFFLECVVGILGIFGSVLCLCTVEVFSLPAPDAMFFVVPVLMLGFCLLFRQRRGGLWGLIVGLVLAGLILLLRRTIFPSAVSLWNVLLNHYSNTYDAVRLIHPKEIPVDPAEAEAALLTLAVLQTWICSLSLARWRRAFPAILALGLGVIPCYIALNTVPAVIPLMMVVLSILLQVLTQSVRRREPQETWKALVWALILSLLLLGGLLYFNPQEDYRQPVTWRELARELEDLGSSFNNRGNVDAGLSGNPDEVEFKNLRSLPNRPVLFLRVAADYTGVCYLRGSSYSGFDGKSWFRQDGESWPEQALYPFLGADLNTYYIRVESKDEEPLFYTAYEMLRLPAGGQMEGDSWYRNLNGVKGYTLRVALDTGGAVPNYDPAYEDWVRQNCTYLPEETRRGLREWWERQERERPPDHDPLYSTDTADGVAHRIAEWISECAVYDRSPDPQPDGTDFCTWFLNDAENGYCVHFATTAAAMLRAFDIPSRYVSGYIVQTTAQKTVDVTNINAHAWVEYYDNGAWHRLEPTPGDASEFTGLIPGETAEPVQTVPVSETAETETVETTEWTTETETRETAPPLPTKPTQPRESEELQGGSHGSGSREEPWTFPKWLWYPIGTAGFVLLVILRRLLVNRIRERKIARAPGNERARLLYHRYRKLCRITRSKVNPEAEVLAKKAVFSQHQIRQDELEFLRQCVDQRVARAEIAGFWKRFYYRYILAIL